MLELLHLIESVKTKEVETEHFQEQGQPRMDRGTLLVHFCLAILSLQLPPLVQPLRQHWIVLAYVGNTTVEHTTRQCWSRLRVLLLARPVDRANLASSRAMVSSFVLVQLIANLCL